jgi:hypothetical protein
MRGRPDVSNLKLMRRISNRLLAGYLAAVPRHFHLMGQDFAVRVRERYAVDRGKSLFSPHIPEAPVQVL